MQDPPPGQLRSCQNNCWNYYQPGKDVHEIHGELTDIDLLTENSNEQVQDNGGQERNRADLNRLCWSHCCTQCMYRHQGGYEERNKAAQRYRQDGEHWGYLANHVNRVLQV